MDENTESEVVEESSEEEEGPSPELLSKARGMGWVPKEEFRGDKSKWTDAAEFVRRGEQIIPIVNAKVRRLESENSSLLGQMKQLQNQLTAATESIEALKELNTKSNIDDAKDARRDLIAQRAKAQREENDDLVVELDEKIQDATATIREAETELKDKGKTKTKEKTEDQNDPPPKPAETPQFKQWKADNPWFETDERRSRYAAFVIKEMAETGELKQFNGDQAKVLAEVTKRVFADMGDPDAERTRTSKVEGSRNGSGKDGSGGGGKRTSGDPSYDDLPAEVKAAAQRMAPRLVGKGRAFPDTKTFQAYYAKKYREDNPND